MFRLFSLALVLLCFKASAAFAAAGAPTCLQMGGFPFQQNSCLNAADLNKSLAINWGGLPPQNGSGKGALPGTWWGNTSTSPITLEQCVNPNSCSTTFVPTDWIPWGTYNTSISPPEFLLSSSIGFTFSQVGLGVFPPPLTGAIIEGTQNTNVSPVLDWVGFGAPAVYTARRADGNGASAAALQTNDLIGDFNSWGYNGSNWQGPAAAFRSYAAEAWAINHQGTYLTFATTPIGTTRLVNQWLIGNDGGLYANGVPGGDEGPGTVNAKILYTNGTATSLGLCNTPLALTYYTTINPVTIGCDNVITASAGAVFLGSSGVPGSASFGNTSSGTVKLQPVSGALGTVTAQLPANSGIIAETNLAQTWTGLQSFAEINATGVDNTPIGQTTPAAAAFNQLTVISPGDMASDTILTTFNNTLINAAGVASGGGSTVIGFQAGPNSLTGIDNTFIGALSGAVSGTINGANNTVVGASNARSLSSGSTNTVVGAEALLAVSSAGGNTTIGYNTDPLGTGSNNTVVGFNAGQTNLTTGHANTILGYNCDLSSTGVSNELDICAGSTAILRTTGGGTPATSTTTVAGAFSAGAIATANAGIGASQTFGAAESSIGFVGDGISDNSLALTALFARTDSPTVYLAAGTYLLTTCPAATLTAASSISIIGAGSASTVFQLPTGCTLPGTTGTIWLWNGKSGVRLEHFTLNLNTPVSASRSSPVLFEAYSGSITGPFVSDIAVTNGTSPTVLFTLAAASGYTMTDPVVENSYFSLAAPATTQNQCLAMTTVPPTTGVITKAVVIGNRCVNVGFQFDGDHGYFAGNDAANWEFGTGFYLANDTTGANNTDHDNIYVGNIAHDSGTGVDINNTAHGGWEIDAVNSLFTGNSAINTGGAGFTNFGNGNQLTGNTSYNTGSNGSGGGGGAGDESALRVVATSAAASYLKSQNVSLSANNTCVSGTTTPYGLYIGSTGVGTPTVDPSNRLCGTAQAIYQQQAVPLQGYTLYSQTQTSVIAGTPALQFTALDTASYTYWHLQCHDLQAAGGSAQKMFIQVGEGATPTWQTGSQYIFTGTNAEGSGAPVNLNGLTLGGIPIDNTAIYNNATARALFSADLATPAGNNNGKTIRIASAYTSSAGLGILNGTGYWGGDQNPITGLQVVAASGNIYGTCTLTGAPN